MRVEVYFNLHQKLWSVVDLSTGLVVEHVNEIAIANPVFTVQPAGRAKVIRDGRKNVHAFIKGTASFLSEHLDKIPYSTQICYDPYKYDSFVIAESKESIFKADVVYLNNKGEVYVS